MINKKVLSIILGGGQGSRLAPLTSHRSKPAVPIAGKYRLVDIPISNCINHDLKRMYVLTQFNSASLNSHVKNTYQFSNFSNAFVDILAAEQTPNNSNWFQGTADAVRQCQHHFERHDYEYALILSGDQLYQMDLAEMIKQHELSGAEITIATQPVTAKEATAFGILKTDDNSFIKTFTEKPPTEELPGWESEVSPEMKDEGREYLASMGIYIFNRKVLNEVLTDTDTTDFGKEIIPEAITGGKKVFAYQYEGYWEDIGTIKSFYEANLALTVDRPKFDLFDNMNTILTRPRVLPPSKVEVQTFTKALISEGCTIKANSIINSVVGIRSRIGEGSIICNTYIMGNDDFQSYEEIDHCIKNNIPYLGIGSNCNISGAIIEKNTKIGNNVTIKGGDHLEDIVTDTYTIRDGVVVIKNNAVIENNTVIGVGASNEKKILESIC